MLGEAVAQASPSGVGQSSAVAAANNDLSVMEVNGFRIAAVTNRLYLHAFGHLKSDTHEFFNLCLSLSRGIDFAITHDFVPVQAQELPSLLKQVSQYHKDPLLLAAIMILMISVKVYCIYLCLSKMPRRLAGDVYNIFITNACRKGWFSDRASEELIGLTTELAKTFGSLQGFTVEPPSSNSIISTVMSRFYPRFKMCHMFAYLEVKPGFDAYVIDLLISKDVKSYPGSKFRLFVVRTDDIETSACLVTPTKVNFLVNGKGVEKRTNTFMDTAPQIPTLVTCLMKYGSNVLQAVGDFNGNYVIAVALMSEMPNPDSSVLKDYEQHLLVTVDSDSDVIEGPSRISVNCPISFCRIKTPVKGHLCKHIQCFDYDNYVDINSRRPSWRCPHCNQYVCFADLRVDQKMVKILKDVETNVSDIIVASDGSWNAVTKSDKVIQKPERTTLVLVDGESPEQMDFLDLTQIDDGLDALNSSDTEDRKLFQANSQSQFMDQITVVDPLAINTNNVLLNHDHIADEFWSAIYRSTLGQGPINSPSLEQTTHVSVTCSSSISLPPVSTESFTTIIGQPGVSLASDLAIHSLPQRENSPNSLHLQQYQFWDQTTIQEFRPFSSIPQHITRTPIAVQALPAQTSVSSLQLPNCLPASSQASPSVPSSSNSFPRVNSLQPPKVPSSSLPLSPGVQPNHALPFARPQQYRGLNSPYQGTNVHGVSTERQRLTQHMRTPVRPNAGRLSPGPTPSSMQLSTRISLSQGHTRFSPDGNGNTRPMESVSSSRTPLTAPAIGVPQTTLNSGQGPRMPPVGDQRSNSTVTWTDSYDPGDQNWRPSSRMRGAISGQAYVDMLNQFIIQPTQQAQMQRPLSNAAQSFIADGTASPRPATPADLSSFFSGRSSGM